MPKLTKAEKNILTEYITNPEKMEEVFKNPYNLTDKEKKFFKIFKRKPNEAKALLNQIFLEMGKDSLHT